MGEEHGAGESEQMGLHFIHCVSTSEVRAGDDKLQILIKQQGIQVFRSIYPTVQHHYPGYWGQGLLCFAELRGVCNVLASI
jgi:hypothetical protein